MERLTLRQLAINDEQEIFILSHTVFMLKPFERLHSRKIAPVKTAVMYLVTKCCPDDKKLSNKYFYHSPCGLTAGIFSNL
ncbi:hypothetical protein SAMN04487894_113102 [Niabella drilacis]|uniref:Uncharacterized protein n=2 Tax=Niabella drilacis (strain DSM 25811 / CCM 8410 / CCUG 62505 / LMG 26954 / E90) TaxID=1285928 RepID=A0A1G6XK48_NIADE|nr:hypothetical protein SAMN04487894_113102 [Niabella drilacis]